MATLTRPKSTPQSPDPLLSRLVTDIPTPFPSDEERQRDEILEELANESLDFTGPSQVAESSQSYHVLVSTLCHLSKQIADLGSTRSCPP
jgi:hypothetical protein